MSASQPYRARAARRLQRPRGHERLRTRWLVTCLALILASVPDPDALAAAAPDAASSSPTVVLMTTPAGWTADRVEALRSQLSDMPVRVVIERTEAASDLPDASQRAAELSRRHDALGTFWFEQSEAHISIYLHDSARSRVLVRRLRRRGGQAAATEAVAIIARLSVRALLEGSEVNMAEIAMPGEPDEPSHPQPTDTAAEPRGAARAGPEDPAPAEHEPPPSLFGVSAAYAGTLFLEGEAWLSGVALELQRPLSSAVYLSAGYTLFTQQQVTRGTTRIGLQRRPVHLVAGLQSDLESWTGAVELSASADSVNRDTLSTSAQTSPTSSESRWLWALGLQGRGAWRFSTHVHAFARAGVELVLDRFSYVVPGPMGTHELHPLRLRPRVELGLALQL